MNSSTEDLEAALDRVRLIVILRLHDHGNVVAIASTLRDAGVKFLEITIERPGAFGALERVVAAVGDDVAIGAGTVKSVEETRRVQEVGARYIVTPNTNSAVIAAAQDSGLLALPGALTPSEIEVASAMGCRFIKLFPASLGGTEYLKSLRGPFPDVKFVPTGGVNAESAPKWFEQGAAAVAMGSNLVPNSGDLDGLFERTQHAVEVTMLATSGDGIGTAI